MNSEKIAQELTDVARLILSAIDIERMIEDRVKECPVLSEGSHQREWHNKSVKSHMAWVVTNAKRIKAATGIDIVEIARYHDIGKVTSFKEKSPGDFSFKEHEPAGANVLRKRRNEHGLSDEDMTIIQFHGSLRKGNPPAELSSEGKKKFALLELADEFGKWSFEHMPPEGKLDRLMKQRNQVMKGAESILGSGTMRKVVEVLMGHFSCPLIGSEIPGKRVLSVAREIMPWTDSE